MPIRKTYTIYDEDELSKDQILKDGEGARFPFRDSAPRPSKTLVRVTDGTGGLHKPGYRLPARGVLSTDAVAAVSQAYADHEAYLGSAYKMDSGPSDGELADDLERVVADLRGDKRQRRDGQSVSGKDAAAAYQDYAHNLVNAWRNP
jgi:hypothetical protein